MVGIQTTFVGYDNLAGDLKAKIYAGTAFTGSGFVAKSDVFISSTISGATQEELEQIPMSGWLRTESAGRNYAITDVNNPDMFTKSYIRGLLSQSRNF